MVMVKVGQKVLCSPRRIIRIRIRPDLAADGTMNHDEGRLEKAWETQSVGHGARSKVSSVRVKSDRSGH